MRGKFRREWIHAYVGLSPPAVHQRLDNSGMWPNSSVKSKFRRSGHRSRAPVPGGPVGVRAGLSPQDEQDLRSRPATRSVAGTGMRTEGAGDSKDSPGGRGPRTNSSENLNVESASQQGGEVG